MTRTAPNYLRFLVTACALLVACGDDDGGDTGVDDGSTGAASFGSTTVGPTDPSTTGSSTTDPGDTSGSSGAAGSSSGSSETEGEDAGSSSGGSETGTGTGGGVCAGADWEAPDWEANVADVLALRAQLFDELSGSMRAAEEQVEGAPTEVAEFQALYDADPSVQAVTTTAFDAIVQDAFEEFAELIAVGPQPLLDGADNWSPGEAGAISGSQNRGINEGGLEVRQVIEKGLFAGAALYNRALELTEGEIDEATIDQLAALWGADATLALADEEGTNLGNPARYSFRMGFFDDTAQALTSAKTLLGNDECSAELEAALTDFFRLWEQSMSARVVAYVAAGVDLGTPASNDEVVSALHTMSEGIGIAAGFVGIEDPEVGPLAGAGRVITDEQISTIMGALGVNLADLGASTTGSTFVGDPDAFTAAQTAVEEEIAEAYGLEIEVVRGWRPE